MKQKVRMVIWFLIGFALLVGVDQWTKLLAVNHLKGKRPLVIWEGVFELSYLENRGAAFGMMQEKQLFFFLIAVVVLAAIVYLLYRMPAVRRYIPLYLCLLLIASGAIGNMIDRVTQKYVVDFLYFKLINFPVFNVADCYVTVASAGLVFLIMFYYKEEELSCFLWKKSEEEAH